MVNLCKFTFLESSRTSVENQLNLQFCPSFPLCRTSYLICGAQCKVKMWGRKINNFYSRALSKYRVLLSVGSCASAEVACPRSSSHLWSYHPFSLRKTEPMSSGLPWTCLFQDFWDASPLWLPILWPRCCLLCSRCRRLKVGQELEVCTVGLRLGKRW